MRLTDQQTQTIRELACQIAGSQSRVRVFGSRLDDSVRGGDLDVVLELPEPVDNPALLAAKKSAQVSRAMHGRKVDVVLSAPNLMRLPIHDIAFKEGRKAALTIDVRIALQRQTSAYLEVCSR